MNPNEEKISGVSSAHHNDKHSERLDSTSEFRRYMLNRKQRHHKMEQALFWGLMAVALVLAVFAVTSILFDVW